MAFAFSPAGNVRIVVPATAEVGRRVGYVPAVDGLRAVAALLVILFHAGLFGFGWAGVWVFYVISGFVMTRGLAARDWTPGVASCRRFFVARARRIWPLYILYIAVAGTLGLLLADHPPGLWAGAPPPGELATFATFTQNFRQMLGYVQPDLHVTRNFDHLWTISVEQQFYLCFPVLFALARRYGALRALLPVVVVALLLRVAFAAGLLGQGVPAGTVSAMLYLFSPGHFDAFAVGMMVALLSDRLVQTGARRRLRVATGLALVVSGLLLLLDPAVRVALAGGAPGALIDALHPYVSSHPTDPVAMVGIFALAVLAGTGLLVAAIAPGTPTGRLLGWPPLAWLGQISYGIYIWHRIPGNAVAAAIGAPDTHPALAMRLAGAGATLACSVLLAALSYHLFERRFHRRIGT